MTERNWENYFELTKSKPPRPLLVKALTYVTNKNTALDLGAGALNDSLYLLSQGFLHVIALDKKPIAQKLADTFPSERFSYKISTLEDFTFSPQVADLVNAQFSLPFVSPESFDVVWENILVSLKEGGIFTGQLFGDRDGWASHVGMTFYKEDGARKLLSEFNLLSFEVDEEDRLTAEGDIKHWHVFHFIARK